MHASGCSTHMGRSIYRSSMQQGGDLHALTRWSSAVQAREAYTPMVLSTHPHNEHLASAAHARATGNNKPIQMRLVQRSTQHDQMCATGSTTHTTRPRCAAGNHAYAHPFTGGIHATQWANYRSSPLGADASGRGMVSGPFAYGGLGVLLWGRGRIRRCLWRWPDVGERA